MTDEKRIYWRNHIERQKSSGQTIAAYCNHQNIAEHRFYYWKAKLAKENDSALFLPVTVQQDKTEIWSEADDSYSSGVSLIIQDQYPVHLETNFSGDTLLKLIDTLEQR